MKNYPICRQHWLDAQLALLAPRLIVLPGETAVRQSPGDKGKLTGLHGKSRVQNSRESFITYHPAAGLRFPNIRLAMRRDFLKLIKHGALKS